MLFFFILVSYQFVPAPPLGPHPPSSKDVPKKKYQFKDILQNQACRNLNINSTTKVPLLKQHMKHSTPPLKRINYYLSKKTMPNTEEYLQIVRKKRAIVDSCDFLDSKTHNKNQYKRFSPKRSTAESVQSPALPFQRIHDVHGSNRLAAGVLGVGNGIPNHILQKDLQNAASFLVYEPADTLHAASTGQPTDRRLGYTLDVIAEDLPVTLRSSLSQSLTSFSPTRHSEQTPNYKFL
nr:histone H4 [Ipomoea batatas]